MRLPPRVQVPQRRTTLLHALKVYCQISWNSKCNNEIQPISLPLPSPPELLFMDQIVAQNKPKFALHSALPCSVVLLPNKPNKPNNSLYTNLNTDQLLDKFKGFFPLISPSLKITRIPGLPVSSMPTLAAKTALSIPSWSPPS